MIPVSPDPPVCPAWMVDPVVTELQVLLDPKGLLALYKSKENVDSQVIQAAQVFQETGVLQVPQALDLRGPQERKVFRVSQEDQVFPEHRALKVNQACQWPRKACQDPEDGMVNQDCPAHQETQVSLDKMDSLVYQEQRVNLDSLELDSQDPQELKVSQVSQASQELLQDQEDQELMDSRASLDYLGPRVNLASVFLGLQVYQEYLDLKGSPVQRETLVSLAPLGHPDDLDLTVVQELKVSPVYQVYPELVVHLDPLLSAHWGHPAHLDPLDQWDHRDSLDQMERRETPVLQV